MVSDPELKWTLNFGQDVKNGEHQKSKDIKHFLEVW